MVENSATEAIKKLEELEEKTQQFNEEDFDQLDDEEYQPHSSVNSIEDEDFANCSEASFEATTDRLLLDFEEDENEDEVGDEKDEVEDANEAEPVENGSVKVKKKKLNKLSPGHDDESSMKDDEIEGVSSTTSDELSELRKIRRVSKVIRDQLL